MTELHKFGKTAAGLVVLIMFLSGCGAAKVPDIIVDNSIIVSKDGKVTTHMVDVFNKDYYDLEGLRKMAQAEAAAYNTANQKTQATPVQVERVESLAEKPGGVVVTYLFDCADTYTAYPYLDESLFYGTVSQAIDAGYSFLTSPQVLRGAKEGQSITSAELHNANNAAKHILITDAHALIYCPFKAEYVSEQAALRADGCVDALGDREDGARVIILMSK